MDPEATRAKVYEDAHGQCRVCGKSVPWPGQLAHRIPQSRDMLKKYGARVIHNRLNLALVCGLGCNDRMSISNHPIVERDLVSSICREMEI
jgi:hypothetical protein